MELLQQVYWYGVVACYISLHLGMIISGEIGKALGESYSQKHPILDVFLVGIQGAIACLFWPVLALHNAYKLGRALMEESRTKP